MTRCTHPNIIATRKSFPKNALTILNSAYHSFPPFTDTTLPIHIPGWNTQTSFTPDPLGYLGKIPIQTKDTLLNRIRHRRLPAAGKALHSLIVDTSHEIWLCRCSLIESHGWLWAQRKEAIRDDWILDALDEMNDLYNQETDDPYTQERDDPDLYELDDLHIHDM
eukprot:TRINITY_DN1583_c1_g1_i1.p1 TRINITY_DN1583_c1_g1~~TRINITY_DN1583_c1_g1_i1.p1  ORF type:complete len:173 (-),score=22.69 TRINITY_DN1583_c1_g1_i1:50-544(-)